MTMEEHPAPDEVLAEGAIIGEHVVGALLGVGGCAAVYRAQYARTGAHAALKILHGRLAVSPKMIARFAREVETIRRVRHPGIVAIDAFGQLPDGRPYYVMELLEGATLASMAKTRGRFSPTEALEILGPMSPALHAVHQAGVVHRDLKASNVFIAGTGPGPTVKILDFGIAKLLRTEPEGEPLTTVGRKLGTPSAMAPEQILGLEVDVRADVYALGVLLFRLLTGRAPFTGETLLEIESGHLGTPPCRPSLLAPTPRAVDEVVLRCLEKHPDDRYRGVLPFLDDLRRAVRYGPSAPGAHEAGELSRRAIGVYVEVRAPCEVEQDELLDDAGGALDAAERALIDARFSMAMQTGGAVLGVLVLGSAGDGSERRRAMDLAGALHRAFVERPGADARVEIQIDVHEDEVWLGSSPLGERIVGGSMLRLGAWVRVKGTGLFVTAALAGESGEEATGRMTSTRRYHDGETDDFPADETRAEPTSIRRPPLVR